MHSDNMLRVSRIKKVQLYKYICDVYQKSETGGENKEKNREPLRDVSDSPAFELFLTCAVSCFSIRRGLTVVLFDLRKNLPLANRCQVQFETVDVR